MKVRYAQIVILFIVISWGLSTVAVANRLGVTANFSIQKYDDVLGFADGLGSEASVFYRLSPSVAVDITGQLGYTQRAFDLIHGQSSLDVRSQGMRIGMAIKPFHFGRSADIWLTAAIGQLSFLTEAQDISLGALGRIKRPAQKDSYTVYSVGSRIERYFGKHWSLQFMPEITIMSAAETPVTYVLKGGLGFVLF